MKIGPFSRGGSSRGLKSLTAADHDMGCEATLVPFGILEVGLGEQAIDQLWLGFGQSRETADFIVDSMERWWNDRSHVHPGVKRLQINLDNGPELKSSRTQFLNRLVQFVDRTGLDVELVYYPPYHSKYNPIERCWGILESHWNGAILSSIEVALNWASTMTWRGVSPIVELIEGVYERGIKLTRSAFRPILERIEKSETLSKWSIKIKAKPVG